MQNVIHTYEGNVAEHKVYTALTKLWHGKRGVILHSFKPERFLSRLTERTKSQRNGCTDIQFTKLERKLSDILRLITRTEAKDMTGMIIQLHPNKIICTLKNGQIKIFLKV